MIRFTQAEFESHQKRLAKLKAASTVRTHRCEGPADQEVLGFGHAQDGKASPKARKSRQRSELEVMLQEQIEKAGLPTAEYDVPYLVGRAHRLDMAWLARKFGVECQGMPHRIKGRFKADIEKRVLGQLQGWLIVEVDREAIVSGKALEWIKQLLNR